MNEIEQFLDHVCCGVAGSPELRRHLREELREHLTEEIEGNVAAGMSREEAVHKAIAEFGDPTMIRDGLQAVHGRRLMSLLIEKSMNWRETTMKTGWKWSFVAQVMLVLTIAAEVYFIAAAVVYVLPGIFAWHSRLGTPTFAYLGTVEPLADALYMDILWIPCLLLVLAGWVLFEWKYRGENKSTIRLAGLSVTSLVVFAVLAIVWVPMGIDLMILPNQIRELQVNLTPQQAERLVVPRIAEGDAAFQELRAAVEREDWSAASQAAEQLDDTYRSLGEVSGGTFMLAGETQRDNLDEIHDLIDAISKTSGDIRRRLRVDTRREDISPDDLKTKTLAHFEQVKESYSNLVAKSDLLAARRNLKKAE